MSFIQLVVYRSGGYTVILMTKATAVDFASDTLFVGWSSGEIQSFSAENCVNEPNGPDFVRTSWTDSCSHKWLDKKGRSVDYLLSFPALDRLLVVCSHPPHTSGCSMKTLDSVSRFSMRDVGLAASNGSSLAVSTSSSIRLLEVGKNGLNLKKTVDYPGGARALCFAGSSLLTASSEVYELIDLTIDSKIPLFPISDTLPPHAAPISPQEFLVVQGPAKESPAMGLIVKFTGEASKQPILWDQYPDSVTVGSNCVLAIVQDELVVHSLASQKLIQTVDLSQFVHVQVKSDDETAETDAPEAPAPAPEAAEPDTVAPAPNPEAAEPDTDAPAPDPEAAEPENKDNEEETPAQPKEDSSGKSKVLSERTIATESPLTSQADLGDETEPAVFRLVKTHDPMFVKSEALSERLGTQVNLETNVALFDGLSLRWWVPEKLFLSLEKEITSGELRTITIDMISASRSEQGVTEFEYLSLLLGFATLKQHRFKDALKAWLDGTQLDPRNVLWLFGDTPKPKMYPKVEEFASTIGNLRDVPRAMDFYRHYLRAQIKKERRSLDTSASKDMERAYSRLVDEDELVEFLLNPQTLCSEELIADLETQKKYHALEKIYEKKGQDSLLEAWYNFLTGKWPCDNSRDYARKIADHLIRSKDSELVWTQTLRLVSLVPEIGVTVFTDPQAEVKFDESLVLDTLKRVDGDVAWRHYLKFLVYDRGSKVHAQSLVMVVVNELIESYNIPGVRDAVSQSYEEYKKLGWPKRPYLQFLQTRSQRLDEEEHADYLTFVDMELEFATLVKDGTDVMPLVAIIDEHAPALFVERCALYRKLGLHTQCLDFLIKDVTDYAAAIWYCIFDSNGKKVDRATRVDLAKYALGVLVKQEFSRDLEEVVAEHLKKQEDYLELPMVLDVIPEGWPASTVSSFVAKYIENLGDEKKLANLERALARGESKWCDTATKAWSNPL